MNFCIVLPIAFLISIGVLVAVHYSHLNDNLRSTIISIVFGVFGALLGVWLLKQL